MVDERLLKRLDVLLVLLASWLVLSLVVASFALMVFDVTVGLLALATVVLTAVVAVRSYPQSRATDPEPDVHVR